MSLEALVERTDATLTTVERLERHQGHLLNWYDTETLAPLLPAYISTVDSGNLAGALMCLAVGAARVPRRRARSRAPALDARLARLATRATALVDGDGLPASSTTGSGGCSPSATGCQDAEGPGRLDPSYYDLLASEARLASFVAIAKGDVPQTHWFHLGPPAHQHPRRAGAAVVERARCSST